MTVEENAKIINLFLREREIDFRSYRQLDLDSLSEIDRLLPILEQLVKGKPWYERFFVADLEGRIVLSTDKQLAGQSIVSRPYFVTSRQGNFFNSGIFYSELLQQPALVLSQPLFNRRGEIIGLFCRPGWPVSCAFETNHLSYPSSNGKPAPGFRSPARPKGELGIAPMLL